MSSDVYCQSLMIYKVQNNTKLLCFTQKSEYLSLWDTDIVYRKMRAIFISPHITSSVRIKTTIKSIDFKVYPCVSWP